MRAPLAQIRLDSDLACNGGAAVAYVQKVTAATATLRLRGDSRVTFECPLDDAAIADVIKGRVARYIYTDGTWEEWRVERMTTEASESGEVRRVECAAPVFDLGAGRVITEWDTQGIPSFSGQRYQITPADLITTVILPWLVIEGVGYAALGTIDPTTPLDVEWSDVTALGLLHQLEELTGCELQFRRNGTTDYKIDLLTETNAAQPVADLREGKNLIGTALTDDATQTFSEIVGLGASDPAGRRATIGRAVWEVSAVNTGTDLITLVDPEGGADPIIEDDQLNGLYLYALGPGTTTQILDSTASPCQVQVADASPYSVGDLLEVRGSAGTGAFKDDAQLIISLTRPSVTPPRAGTLDRADLYGERNLIPNGRFSAWAGGANAAPDDWTLEWNRYGAQDTTYPELGANALALRYLPHEVSFTPLTSSDTVITNLTDTSGFVVGMVVEIRGNSFTWETRTVVDVTATTVEINAPPSTTHLGSTIIQGKGPGATIGTPRVISGSVRAPVAGGSLFCAQAKVMALGFPVGQYLFTLALEHLSSTGLVTKRLTSQTNIIDQWVVLNVPTQATSGESLRVSVEILQDPAATTVPQPGNLLGSHALIVDAVGLTQTDYQPASIPDYSFANQFWHAVNRELLSSRLGASYDVALVDLTALDPSGWPDDELMLGATVRVNQHRAGYRNALLRIVEMQRPNLFEPATALVVLGERPRDLTELIDRALAAVGRGAGPVTAPGGGSSTPGGTPLPPPPPTSLPPGSPPPPAPLALPLLKTILDSGQRHTLADFPLALTDLFHGGEFLADFTSIPQAFLSGHIHASAACPGEIRLQYLRTTDGTWRYLDGAGGPALPMRNAGRATGASVSLETDARGPRWCKPVGIDGDDAADPVIGHLALHGGVATSAVLGDWLELIQQLGGDAAVPFFYDGRFNTTAFSGGKISAIDDVRGASGYGPQLTSGATSDYPLYDSTNGELQFASGQALVSAAESALVDLTGPFTLVYVGTATWGGGGRKFLAAVGAPTNTATTVLGVRTDGATIQGEALVSATHTTLDTTVAVSSSIVRVAIVGQDGGTALTAQAPNTSQVAGVLAGAMTPTQAFICLMEQTNNDTGNRGIGAMRAFFAVSHVLTATEINAIQAWAVLRRHATTA